MLRLHLKSLCLLALASVSAFVNAQTTTPICTGGPIESPNKFDANKDYFADAANRVEIKHAKNFQVTYNKNYKLATVTFPDGKQKAYKLHLCNSATAVPTDVGIPIDKSALGLKEVYAVGFLQRLEQLSKIAYIQFDVPDVSSPCLLGQVNAGQTIPYSEPGIPSNTSVVFGSAGPDGVPVVSVAEAMLAEQTPLARAEWIKFYSLFFNLESKATSIFENQILAPYQCMASYAKSAAKTQKTVLWVAADKAETPASSFSGDGKYETELITDAGATRVLVPAGSTKDATLSIFPNANTFIDDTDTGKQELKWGAIMGFYGFDASQGVNFPWWRGTATAQIFKPDNLRLPGGLSYTRYNAPAIPEVVLRNLIQVLGGTYKSPDKIIEDNLYFRHIPLEGNAVHLTADDCAAYVYDRTFTSPTGFPDCATAKIGDSSDGGHGGVSSGGVAVIVIFIFTAIAAAVLGYMHRYELREWFGNVRERGFGGSHRVGDPWGGKKFQGFQLK
ncbi:uncharacterized protein EV422DRAFT_611469 [Fimicolochytrium jonesii]|uniref:uncharacterized protein n=1 Tax=Fimicolochytrium jonesii TaxID=1396493 RepID=UPI0022FEC45E|nr:uncharacterized protein EV422DRAFT_611469 [Fimicolochytrium jonesii]KAI8823397.1 hypothetical protein EV422DRAFT_611469 [Fimicolochytrium jonesii]